MTPIIREYKYSYLPEHLILLLDQNFLGPVIRDYKYKKIKRNDRFEQNFKSTKELRNLIV